MMSQESALKFLQLNGVDVTHMTYNLANDIIAVARRCAEEDFKRYLLVLCEANGLLKKGGAEE